jgi:hypothetical protein
MKRTLLLLVVALIAVLFSAPNRAAAAVNAQGKLPYVISIDKGDTLFGIANRGVAKTHCGSPQDYRRLATENNISNPDRIFAGKPLIITCAIHKIAPMTRPVITTMPSISYAFAEPPDDVIVPALDAFPFLAMNATPAPSEPIMPAQPARPIQPAQPRTETVYEISVPASAAENLFPGQFPARFAYGQNPNGTWKEIEDTRATIHPIGTLLIIEIPLKAKPQTGSLLAISLKNGSGKETIQPIGGMEQATLTTASPGEEQKNFTRGDYKTLTKFLQKQPNPMASVGKTLLPIGLRTATGFFYGGPIGAAIGGPGAYLSEKIRRKIENNNVRIAHELSPPSAAEQFIIATQAKQIEQLNVHSAEQDQLIKSLQVAIAAIQAKQQ